LIKALHAVASFPTELLAKPFNGQTLFIRGEKSPYIPDKDIPELQNIFKNCKVDTIKGAGHWPHAEKINDFLASLVPFLRS
jgi:esterase